MIRSPLRPFLAMCLIPCLAAQHLAWDEGDGQTRGGFAGSDHGGWNAVVRSEGGVLLATSGNDWRSLLAPITTGTVWYAVTLRMQQPILGYASVVPAARPGHQFSELGFNTGFGNDQGLWTNGPGLVHDGIAATTLQTFLQRYDLANRRWSAWAVAGDGSSLLAADGSVAARPLVQEAPLAATAIGALYLTKGSPQVLEIHRLALARTAVEALTPVTGQPAHTETPPPAPILPALPRAGLDAFARAKKRPGGVSFFGDSLTWQGGHVERLRQVLVANGQDGTFPLRQRGINGGKSTDLVAGVKDLYGCTQAPFAEVLAADQPAAVVIQIGINDVWHHENGNPPAVYEQALRTMLAAAAQAQVPVLLCTPTVIGERRAGSNPDDAGLDAVAAVVRKLAAEPGPNRVLLCDLRRQFQEHLARRNVRDDDQGVFTYDRVHLSDDGNALLAHLLGDGLATLLGSAPEKPVAWALLPTPRQRGEPRGRLPMTRAIAVDATAPSLQAHARVLQAALQALTRDAGGDGRTHIALRLDPTLGEEHYRLEVDRAITITGRDLEAVARGSATLLQLRHVDQDVAWPQLTITDSPTCGYRGLLVDVARQPHPIAVLEDLVTLCWFHKIRYLQLHLTDDQAFTFPSTAFPKLATPGHGYTLAELRHLHDFAQARGVTIVPELDVPGHCGAMIQAMPEVFRASDKHHATIAFARPQVLAAIDTLIGEMLDVFPSTPFFHVGGDECDLTHVHENPDFQAAFARENVPDARQLYRRFLCQLRDKVHARGRRMIVWEGFGPEGGVEIPKDVIVMAFEMLYHTPDQLVAAGYPVINTSWRPLYVVNDRCWDEAEIHRWHRGAFRHFVEGFPAFQGMEVPRERILGAQMCAWEQPAERELPSLRRRLAAMAERVWNEPADVDTDTFLARLGQTDRLLTRILDAR